MYLLATRTRPLLSPFSSVGTLLERETALNVRAILLSCIIGETEDNVTIRLHEGVYDPVPRNRFDSMRLAFNIAVTRFAAGSARSGNW